MAWCRREHELFLEVRRLRGRQKGESRRMLTSLPCANPLSTALAISYSPSTQLHVAPFLPLLTWGMVQRHPQEKVWACSLQGPEAHPLPNRAPTESLFCPCFSIHILGTPRLLSFPLYLHWPLSGDVEIICHWGSFSLPHYTNMLIRGKHDCVIFMLVSPTW